MVTPTLRPSMQLSFDIMGSECLEVVVTHTRPRNRAFFLAVQGHCSVSVSCGKQLCQTLSKIPKARFRVGVCSCMWLIKLWFHTMVCHCNRNPNPSTLIPPQLRDPRSQCSGPCRQIYGQILNLRNFRSGKVCNRQWVPNWAAPRKHYVDAQVVQSRSHVKSSLKHRFHLHIQSAQQVDSRGPYV